MSTHTQAFGATRARAGREPGEPLLPGAAAPGRRFPITPVLALPFPVRSMLHRWRGLVGMMLGVGIALGMVNTLLGIGAASVEIYTGDYTRSTADLYIVQRGGTLIPILPSDTPGTIKGARAALAAIRGMPGVNEAVGVMTWSLEHERPGPRRRDEPTELFSVMGVDGDPERIAGMLHLRRGRWVRRSNEIVVGDKLSREKGIGLGDTVRLNRRDFTVVGIGRLRGFGFGGESMAFMDYRAFRQRAGLGDVVSIIAVDTARPDLLRERLPDIGSLTAFDPPELAALAEQARASATAFYWILSALALLIGGLFVSNMLGQSVAERRLEFATLRAIGVPSRTILLAVAMESVAVSAVAGALGVGISLFFGWLINAYLAPQFGLESLYTADARSFLNAFLIAFGLGLAAGFLPARRATRVDPVDVLREA